MTTASRGSSLARETTGPASCWTASPTRGAARSRSRARSGARSTPTTAPIEVGDMLTTSADSRPRHAGHRSGTRVRCRSSARRSSASNPAAGSFPSSSRCTEVAVILRAELGSGVSRASSSFARMTGVARPASVKEMLARFREPIVFDEPLITPRRCRRSAGTTLSPSSATAASATKATCAPPASSSFTVRRAHVVRQRCRRAPPDRRRAGACAAPTSRSSDRQSLIVGRA